ncbi:MAG: hypothetical protein JSS72_08405 [Armatimonadetes bacterium]|nr:hypothetical protein [Armatimonadota bacterium]
MNESSLIFKKGAIVVAIGLFLFFVYPTPYEYTRKAPDVWRVNRFTGQRDISTADGWKSESEIERKNAEAETKAKQALQADDEKLKAGQILGPISIGAKGQYSVFLTMAYIDSKCIWRAEVKPFSGEIRHYLEPNPYQYPTHTVLNSLQVDLLGANNLTIRKLINDDGALISDGKEGFAGFSVSGSSYMSKDEYKSVKAFTCTWRW